jgi:hypothetical protein
MRFSQVLGQAVIVLSSGLSLNLQAGSSIMKSGWLLAKSSAARAGLSVTHEKFPPGVSYIKRLTPSVAKKI